MTHKRYKGVNLSEEKNSFEFTIHRGSGYFSVSTNNTEIADIIHRDRKVTVIAKDEGALLIKVEDTEIPEAEFAYAELLISDIWRLELDAPGLLIE